MRASPGAEKSLSALHPEKSWSLVIGRGFNSRHLHHFVVATSRCRLSSPPRLGPVLRDPGLTPEAWRGRRLALHPLLVLPLLPLGALPLAVGRLLAGPTVANVLVVAHLLCVAMVASFASPWHLPQPPRYDPIGRTITFRARYRLGLTPLGLALWGVLMLVHFELMRLLVVPRLPSWWLALPLGFALVAGGLHVARPKGEHRLMVGVDGLHLARGRGGFTAPWDQVRRLIATESPTGEHGIDVDGSGLLARDSHGHRVRPHIEAGVLDTDAVRLWLTLEHYRRHPGDREELGTTASRRRRARWRRVLPRG